MRFGFVTCVELGLACMEEIYKAGGSINLALSLKDELATNKSGRIFVDEFCSMHKIDLIKIKNINDNDAVNAVKTYDIDWLFIIGWSQIARDSILHTPKRGVIGMHPTLLPLGRGRAAIPWAILKGLPETGVSMFKLDEGVDTGPLLAQNRIPIASDETATSLYKKVCEAHKSLIRCNWKNLVEDNLILRRQNESMASEWQGRRPEDGEILPDMSVYEAEKLIRATSKPYPGAFWKDKDKVVRIWSGVIGKVDEEPPENAIRIYLKDGVVDALHFNLEPIYI